MQRMVIDSLLQAEVRWSNNRRRHGGGRTGHGRKTTAGPAAWAGPAAIQSRGL